MHTYNYNRLEIDSPGAGVITRIDNFVVVGAGNGTLGAGLMDNPRISSGADRVRSMQLLSDLRTKMVRMLAILSPPLSSL